MSATVKPAGSVWAIRRWWTLNRPRQCPCRGGPSDDDEHDDQGPRPLASGGVARVGSSNCGPDTVATTSQQRVRLGGRGQSDTRATRPPDRSSRSVRRIRPSTPAYRRRGTRCRTARVSRRRAPAAPRAGRRRDAADREAGSRAHRLGVREVRLCPAHEERRSRPSRPPIAGHEHQDRLLARPRTPATSRSVRARSRRHRRPAGRS